MEIPLQLWLCGCLCMSPSPSSLARWILSSLVNTWSQERARTWARSDFLALWCWSSSRKEGRGGWGAGGRGTALSYLSDWLASSPPHPTPCCQHFLWASAHIKRRKEERVGGRRKAAEEWIKAVMYGYPVIVICLLHDSRLCYNY